MTTRSIEAPSRSGGSSGSLRAPGRSIAFGTSDLLFATIGSSGAALSSRRRWWFRAVPRQPARGHADLPRSRTVIGANRYSERQVM